MMSAPSITDVYQGRHPYWTYWSRGNKITAVETERGEERRMAQQARSVTAGYRRDGTDPPYLYPDYKATRLRAPGRPLTILPHTLSEITGPVYGHERVGPLDHDLTRQHGSEPLGERIIVTGRVLDGDGRPVRSSLVEIWQANAAGRYVHQGDRHPAPLDPNFTGAGRCLTDDEGRYRFVTVKPGAYPWGNHDNAWRPAHIHSRRSGGPSRTRLSPRCTSPAIRSSTRTRSSSRCEIPGRASA